MIASGRFYCFDHYWTNAQNAKRSASPDLRRHPGLLGLGTMTTKSKWLEVWFHDDDPPYFLRVGPSDGAGRVAIFDIREDSLAYMANDYEDACLWLRDEEFEMVKGRERADASIAPSSV